MLTITYGTENENTPAILMMAFIWQGLTVIMKISGNTHFFFEN